MRMVLRSRSRSSDFRCSALHSLPPCHSLHAGDRFPSFRLQGVIINKIQPDKVEMIREYMGKALQRWNLGLLACIPDAHFLGMISQAAAGRVGAGY